TRALTYRIAYLLEQGLARPHEIMAVTFTNKAAREMKARVAQLVGPEQAPSAIGTFHGLCARLLREQYRLTNRSAAFTIFDTSDSQQLIKQALDAQGVSSREWSPTKLRHEISRAKNTGLSPTELAAQAQSPTEALIATTYQLYQGLLVRNDAFDFDDLIVEALRVLATQTAVRERYQQQWRWLSVDEYQDTNGPQERLLQLLLGPEKNICVVGDDYQAIYSWRGARVDHILHFSETFPQCTTIYLTQNYRSSPAILEAANHIIAENQEQLHKELWTNRTATTPVRIMALPSDRQEARWVRQQIEHGLAQGGSASQWVILYRTNAQSRLFEEEFLLHRLPYTIVGGFRFYDRREVKDAVALLQLWVNPRSTVALRRLTQALFKGVGPKTIARWSAAAEHNNESLLTIMSQAITSTPRQRAAVAPLLTAFAEARARQFANVAELLLYLIEATGLRRQLKLQPDGDERLENIEELANVAALYTEATEFLENVALMSDIDELNEATERITCMTLHAAKGLEFPHVFIVGCEEGLLPHMNSIDSSRELEEERRLLYVGMTRAKEQLTVTHANTRTIRGEFLPQLPSRFLTALPATCERYAEQTDLSSADPFVASLTGTANAEPVTVAVETGEFITHPVFGRGVVIQISGSLITCVFETYGVKTIDSAVVNTLSS
ncbi:MAG: UvrD-helicase domain-containing protein, partial [Candidatus Andersenbacteria bacterium]